jgi:hypothetical protein
MFATSRGWGDNLSKKGSCKVNGSCKVRCATSSPIACRYQRRFRRREAGSSVGALAEPIPFDLRSQLTRQPCPRHVHEN